MPPKKAATTDTNDPPRRSGRIASQPVIAEPPGKTKAPKKRTAVDGEAKDGEEGSSAKKVLIFFSPFFFLFLREELKYALI